MLGSLFVVLLLMALIGGFSIYNVGRISNLSEDMYSREFVGMSSVERARVLADRFRIASMLAVFARTPAERDQELVKRDTIGEAFEQELKALRSVLYSAETIAAITDLEAAWPLYKSESDAAVAALMAGQQERAVDIIFTSVSDRREALETLLDSLSAAKSRVSAEEAAAARQTAQDGWTMTIALLLGALAIGTAITVWLRQMVASISASATTLSGTTSGLLASILQQESSTTEQAAAVTQTSAAIDEIRATAIQTTQRAREVATLAQDAAAVATEGNTAVQRSVTGMQELRGRVDTIASHILALSEQTQKVGEIITSVEELADQSTLLAVNAAIEAARAGEQGRGFAVVAQEVRHLAERSKAATVQVRTLLTNIQRATNAAAMATEQGTKGAEESVRVVERAGSAISRLDEAIRHAADAAQQIQASAGQQGMGMDQIATAMVNINQATHETAAGTRQLQKTAEDVNEVVATMSRLIGRHGRNGRNGRHEEAA
jgi:methyl-accepting chemotaxis protein